jgi:glutamyl-Q tRNA(Asp) synthetase
MYVGRFAPSPTGPLHFGSLVAAVASYCEAKANSGKWLLRMDDLDKPREMTGAATNILHTLEGFGFEWDGELLYQSQRAEAYEEALDKLRSKNVIYPCTCSRKEIADSSTKVGIEGKIYPKTCLMHPPKTSIHAAYRVITNDKLTIFHDEIQGKIHQNLAHDIGDFVLKRADGLFAYQLAVVVDDAVQGVTHVVRGADLLDSTPRQIYLQQLLEFSTPSYAHVPIAVNLQGEKLSKQTLAEPISKSLAGPLLVSALHYLGQNPPPEMQNATLDKNHIAEVWRWALENWSLAKISHQRTIAYER